MDVRERHLGRIAAPAARDTVRVDVGALVRRLILFEQVILESVRLKEVPDLVRVFGSQGLIDLIESGAVTIICDAMTAGSTGQTAGLNATRRRGGPLPSGSYHLASIQIADRPWFTHEVIQEVHNAPIPFNEAKRLKSYLASKIESYPSAAGHQGVTDTEGQLQSSHPIVGAAIRLVVQREMGTDPGPTVAAEVHALEHPGDFRIETTLGRRLGIDPGAEHKLVELGILALAGLNQRLCLMEAFEAVTGFQEDEEPLFDQRLAFLLAQVDPTAQERRLGRVVTLRGLPSLDPLDDGYRIDVARLLKMRESEGWRAFRMWLRGIDGESDVDLDKQLGGLRSALSSLGVSGPARVIRFAVTQAAGLVPGAGPAVGLALSAVDTFLLNRLLGTPGPAAFIGANYPSIFQPGAGDRSTDSTAQ